MNWTISEQDYLKLPKWIRSQVFRRKEGLNWIIQIDANYRYIKQISVYFDTLAVVNEAKKLSL